MPAEPFWGLLALLYGVLAIVAGAATALLAAALCCAVAGGMHLAIRIAAGTAHRGRPEELRHGDA